MSDPKGATLDDWFHFDFVLGLGSNLLPCVPFSPDVQVVKGSALDGKVGKIPSQFNSSGLAHGLLDWQKRPILSNEIQLWQADRRLNICVRTGALSGVYALDVDVEDGRATEILDQLQALLGIDAIRTRENSRKFLLPFRMEGERCPKRKIFLEPNGKGAAIELLGDGQQFVAAGSHASGVRYEWTPCLPTTLRLMSLEQVNQLWTSLEKRWSAVKTSSIPATPGAQVIQPTVDNQIQTTISEEEWPRLIDALRTLLPTAGSNDRWSEIGYALLSLQGSRPVRQLFIDFSRKAPGFQEGAPEHWWEQHARQTPRTDYRHIFNLAKGEGWGRVSDASVFGLVESTGAAAQGSGGSDDNGALLAPLPPKPEVKLIDGAFTMIVAQCEDLLANEVYSQGPHLSYIAPGHDNEEIRRNDDAVMLVRASPQWMRVRLGELATWQRYAPKKQAWYTVDPTSEHTNALASLGSWRKIKPLNAIARSPFVREDGSICDKPGYDNRTRVLYVPSAVYPDIPTNPSRDQASEALERLRGVFDQFPWKEPASESAFLSHILTEAARLAIDRAPMYFYDAPSAGTGKGLLQEMAARIVHGSDPALRPWVGDGDEIRKALYASILAGDRSLWFDNIPDGHKVRSPELCAFITSSTWKDRKLGESETVGVPNKMVLVGSGNNITPVSDLARRSLVVRMDANTERMKERVFKLPDLRAHVMANRHLMLVDALTIIKAFTAVSYVGRVPLPSFVQWSRFCRDPLMWLGMPDPVITQNETDDESKPLKGVFEMLVQQFGERAFISVDIARLAGGISDQDGHFTNALLNAGCGEPNNPTKIGYWLRSKRDKIAAGYKLIHAGECRSGIQWQFKRVNEDLT